MSFIEAPQALTPKQVADQSGARLLATLKQECKRQFELAWKKGLNGRLVDKTFSEAQVFFDAYGVKATLAFDLHAKLQELIYLTDNTWVPLVPVYAYVRNQDGTVIITEPVIVEPVLEE